ncbi:MAG: hypothetical protein AABY15_02030 [Nanoarchaeota archaeon]
MEDYITEAHVAAIKKEVEEGRMPLTKTIGIEMLNMESFKIKLKDKKGIASIGEMVEIRNFIDGAIKSISHITHTILHSDKKSPLYWGKVDERDDDGRKYYQVSINLETFMEESSEAKEVAPGYVIPDNYALAEKVLNAFEKSGNDVKGIEDVSFRECATWEIKSKKQAKKLVKFIDETYVIPKLKELMEVGNIKKVIYTEKQFEFVFNKKRKEK